jgi:hypothetical protein
MPDAYPVSGVCSFLQLQTTFVASYTCPGQTLTGFAANFGQPATTGHRNFQDLAST